MAQYLTSAMAAELGVEGLRLARGPALVAMTHPAPDHAHHPCLPKKLCVET